MKYNLYHLRYWHVWLLVGLFRLLSLLPYRWLTVLGQGLGWLMRHIGGKSQNAVQTNLRLCFPNESAAWRQQIYRASYASLGIGLLESILAWWASDQRLRPLAHVHGVEHLQQAHAQGKGVLLLSAHFTGLELAGRLLRLHIPYSVSYRQQKNPVLNHLISKIRHKIYQHAFTREDIRGMMRALSRGEYIFYAADTDVGRQGLMVPFFGNLASTTKATARYAKRTGALIMPCFFYRRSDGTGYDVHIDPPLTDFPTDDPIADATRINSLIEQAIRKHPEQYLWQYRRFKTRPNNEPHPYS
jgi:Kdo2-lipid IVA lauroyltransferase/acyltransferase